MKTLLNTVRTTFSNLNLLDKILLLFILFICSRIIYLTPSFDGAMNLLPAKNLVLFGKYYSYYFEQYFYHGIQTRFTLQMPAAFFMWIGGVSYFTALLPSAIYTFIFVLISWKLVVKLTPSIHHENLFIIPLFLFIPDFFHVGLKGWGEVITYFFTVLALLQWIRITEQDSTSRKNAPYLFMGVFIGLSILTKTVALITLPAFAGGILYQTIKNKQIDWRFLYTLLGILIPIASYELWKIYLMGFDQYIKWWTYQSSAISSQAGVASKVTVTEQKVTENLGESSSKFMNHLNITASNLYISTKILLLYFIIPSFLTVFFHFKGFLKKNSFPIIIFIFLLIWGYFVWWMAITPTNKVDDYGKFRRLLPAFIMNTYLIAITTQTLIELNKDKLKSYVVIATITSVGIFISCFIGLKSFNKTTEIITTSAPSSIHNEFYRKLNSLPQNAKIFGNAYRQAPQVALKYNRHFTNNVRYSFDELINGEDHYIILDDYLISRGYFNPILEVIDYNIIAENKEDQKNEMQLIKINGYKEEFDLKRPRLSNCVDLEKMNTYPNKFGFYPKNNQNWTTPKFNVTLDEGNYNYLFLTFYTNPNVKYKDKQTSLELSLNSQLLKKVKIQKGRNHLKIPIDSNWCNTSTPNQVAGLLNTYAIKSASYYGLICNQACLKTIEETNNIIIKNMRINSSKKLVLRIENVSDNIAVYINDRESKVTTNMNTLACKLPGSTSTASSYMLEIFDLDKNVSQKFNIFMDRENQIVRLLE